MIFAILNSSLFPIPRTHFLHVLKLSHGFVQNGFQFITISNYNEIKYLSTNDILYVSNHFSVDPLRKFFSYYTSALLAKALCAAKCKLLLWNFHTVNNVFFARKFNSECLHLGESLSSSAISAEPVLARFRDKHHTHQLLYSSVNHPSFAPFHKSKPTYIVCNYVGSSYKLEFLKYCQKNYPSLISVTPPTVSEAYRVNSFINSQVNLVFHSPHNIKKGFYTERFAESISNGGLVIHDHPKIKEDFGDYPGMRYVENIVQLKFAINEIKHMSESEYSDISRINYSSWVKSDLSYYKQASLILRELHAK